MDIIGLIFVIYLMFLLGVGVWTYKFNKSQEDYLLAGRKLGPWIIALSERASGESAWLLLALPGAVITIGLGEVWAVIGIIVGIISSWYLIAEKLRIETEKYNALTIPDYFHKRFNDQSNFIRLFSSIIIAFFFLFYVSAQFHASGKILYTLFNLNPISGITIGGIIIIIYTLMGGLYAVAWTDFLQGILMFGTLVILPIAGLIELSENSSSISEGFIAAESIFHNHNNSFFMGNNGIAGFATMLGGLSWGLGYLGQPHLLIRYMAIKNPKDIKIARNIALAWAFPGIIGAFFVGAVSLIYFGPEFFQLVDPEQAMPLLASELLHPILAGLFISGAVAAMMSTADSQLLVSTSAVTKDLGISFKHNKKKINSVTNSRIFTIIMGLIAYCIAIFSQYTGKTIFGVVSYAWSGLGAAFGPALVLTLWWDKITKRGVLGGLIIGFLTTVIWANIPELKSLFTERLSSFIFSFLTVYFVSLYTQDEY